MNPTHVGMNRTCDVCSIVQCDEPHARGDEPDACTTSACCNRICSAAQRRCRINRRLYLNYQELPKLRDSVSYLYLEHAIIERDENAIVAISKEGRTPIPVSGVTCLLLGPGTNVTHAAIRIMAEFGCMVIWCGEGIGRFYASGLGETRSAANILAQARACMDDALHMAVVREMYAIRFPGFNTSRMTLC